MNSTDYDAFTQTLTRNLTANPNVLGLVAAGSMAAQGGLLPDVWSDHDFFVVAAPGTEPQLRADLSWLPQADAIVLSFAETEHGLKALYRHGHLLEFAVMDPATLAQARLNQYRLLLDRANLAPRLAQAAANTETAVSQNQPSDHSLLGQFLANLFVAAGRHARGERLSGRLFVQSHAMYHLLRLLARHLPAPERPLLDNLDPFRRFERVFPAAGAALADILQQDTLTAAADLIAFAETQLAATLNNFPHAACRVVLDTLHQAAIPRV